jgi:hypothetical protein
MEVVLPSLYTKKTNTKNFLGDKKSMDTTSYGSNGLYGTIDAPQNVNKTNLKAPTSEYLAK